MKTVIIYNPNSTGDSEANARALAKQLKAANIDVLTIKTTHAGHGEEIAAQYARSGEAIILISSSGDGGYHEVVNGALSLSSKKLIVGVLPSGNANDHYSAIGSGSLADSIEHKKFQRIDTIKVTSKIDGKPWVRFAHSYAGIGVAADAAKTLTEDRPNALSEKWIVARALFSFDYVKLKEKRKTRRYSSLLFGNINTMSKVLKLSDDASVKDGKFELSAIRFRSKIRLLLYFMSAATIGLKQSRSLKRAVYRTVDALPIQLDGEVFVLDANSKLKIESVKQNLHCVL